MQEIEKISSREWRELHDDGRNINVNFDALVRKDRASVNVYLIADSDIVTKDRDILKTRPLADGGVPSDNGALDPGVVLDLATAEKDRSLDSDTVSNNNIWTNGNVWTNSAVLTDLSGWVDENITTIDICLAGRCEGLGALLCERGEVETGSGKEILWLSDIHPESLEVEGVELSIGANSWEGLLLDGGWAKLDAVKNRWVEDVKTSVDAVADELDWLLNESVDAGSMV